ncbi:thiosulfate/3-mercaptopyruvate sulfurtransferase [Blastococcus aggregatus]|uniref:Sulfurtransferase n=1 Tax=Blastococcus aggregatus TaxID=38502 RepID=A0A285V2N6_9ACTN|nr:sulfurtransferase [Blastococcus aggregatus]SOC47848.1 thiosulfate/3-mercaptopyruvate sulfurtransferase [Blastococcus aggregatus]
MARTDVLVDGDWLEKHLADPAVVIVEVDEDSAAYYANHIPGAVALDWRTDLQDPLRRDFVDRAAFEALLSAKGVTAEDTVILYGGNNNWFAAYAYWYFKVYGHRDVRLLDGGRKRWELDGRPLDTEPVSRPTTTYVAQDADPAIRAFRDEVVASIGSKTIVDVRSPQEFSGEILAPASFPQEQPQVGGHVPTSVNVPWSKAAAEDGTFRSDEELRALYTGAGVDLSGQQDTIVYCRVGERSAHTWFVLRELLDQPQVKNYDGSWVEYGSLVGVPIEK